MGLFLSLLPCGCWAKEGMGINPYALLFPLPEGREEKRGGWSSPLQPSTLRAAGRAQAHIAPKSVLPLSTRAVLLGMPRSCLTPSRLDEHPEGAGCMHRLLHVLLTWPVRVHALAGPQAQGQGP